MTIPNSLTSDLIEKAERYLAPNYAQQPIVLDHGEGAEMVDIDGTAYLDLASGIAVTALGHNHPELKAALNEAANQSWHVSNVFYHSAPILLAEAMVGKLGFDAKVFFANSGAEANEAALKLARRYQWQLEGEPAGAAKRHKIVSFNGGFHGRTYATVTATAQPKYHEGFYPLPEGYVYTDYSINGIQAIDADCAAVIVECIQGEGGVRTAEPAFLKALRARCDEMGALLIIDEIQTGFCRTGRWFAFQHFDIEPDIVTVAKSLGGGLPIGAMLAKSEVAASLSVGSHGSTFGGNPIASAVAHRVIEVLERTQANEQVKLIEARVKSALQGINQKYPIFAEIRGMGAMIGAELVPQYAGSAGKLVTLAKSYNLLVLVAGPDVLRLQIPYIISDAQLDDAMGRLEKAVKAFYEQGSAHD